MRSESDGHCRPTSFPGLAVRDGACGAAPRAARAQRLQPLPADGRRVPRPRRRAARADAAGTTSFVAPPRRARARGRRRLRARRTHGVVPPRPARARAIPGSRCPRSSPATPRVVHAYEPHEYARRRRGRRRRHGGGDGVAERARRGRHGRLGSPARAGAPAAEPAAPALLAARARGVPRDARRRARAGLLRAALGAVVSAGTRAGTSRSSAAREGRFRVAAELNGAAQVICATGFRRGFAHDPLLARLVDEHGLETRGPLDRARARLDRARAHRRRRGRSRSPACRRSGRFPAADTLVGAKYAARALPATGWRRCRTR